MSSSAGPTISLTGLVLDFDTANTQKSWLGKPTTNYIFNPTEEMARGEFGQYRDLAPAFNTYGLVPYSLSMDIKANKPGSILVYMQNGSSTKYGFVSNNVNVTTDYQRFYFNNITPSISNAGDTAATLATYTGYGSGINPTVKNIQLELGSFATPFVNGSRGIATTNYVDPTWSNWTIDGSGQGSIGTRTIVSSYDCIISDSASVCNICTNSMSIPELNISDKNKYIVKLKCDHSYHINCLYKLDSCIYDSCSGKINTCNNPSLLFNDKGFIISYTKSIPSSSRTKYKYKRHSYYST
jgi:hypothetical protein